MDRARKVRRRQERRQKRRRRRRGIGLNYRMNWLTCQRQFLTAWLWKGVRAAARPYGGQRWDLLPLVMVGLLMLFLTAHSVAERFEEARELWTRLNWHRRRVGRTLAGFGKAWERLPRRALRVLGVRLRERVATVLRDQWDIAGWVPFGVDGSRLALPRLATLERRFGTAGTGDVPQMWLTSLVHLRSGVPWSWRLGRGDSSERDHLLALLDTLPARALLVADAGYVGYRVWSTLQARGQAFLIRLSSHCTVYADYHITADFTEGHAYLWPQRRPKQRPLPLRLLRLPGQKGRDVWLATNVLDPTRLSRQTASALFRLRWEQEVFYRSYKCTLRQAKLAGRTPKHVMREAELALLGTQLFMAQAAWAVQRGGGTRRASVAEAARQMRRELRHVWGSGCLRSGYLERLANAEREDRSQRTSAKNYREWPRQKPHPPPGPPIIATLTGEQKVRLFKELKAA